MDGEALSEALLNFVEAPDFKAAVQTFFDSRRRHFSASSKGSHSHRQFSIWREYQQLVESLIDSALSVIGGSVEMLEAGLEDIARREPSGPREAMVQEVVTKLLSYHRYDRWTLGHFYYRISSS